MSAMDIGIGIALALSGISLGISCFAIGHWAGVRYEQERRRERETEGAT